MRRIVFLVLVMALMFGTMPPAARAQGQPPGASPQGQRPPHPGNTTGQPTPSHLPPEIHNGPYNGPSTKAPPGLQVPHNQQEAAQAVQRLQSDPAVAAANQVSQAAIAARRDLGQRLRAGQMPTEADKQLGRSYQINLQPPPQPPAQPQPQPQPRRSDDPTGILKLLGLGASPAAEPVAEPDAQGAYFGGFLCFVWENFYLDRDQWGDEYFGSQGLNYCFPPATNEAVLYNLVSMDIYKCGAFFPTWNICIGEQHWYELWPSCEGYHVTYVWCGGGGQNPRAMYPQGTSGAYFLRVLGHIQTLGGSVGQTYIDSAAIPYNCFQGLMVIC